MSDDAENKKQNWTGEADQRVGETPSGIFSTVLEKIRQNNLSPEVQKEGSAYQELAALGGEQYAATLSGVVTDGVIGVAAGYSVSSIMCDKKMKGWQRYTLSGGVCFLAWILRGRIQRALGNLM